ncbi:DUF6795 domain-containing protein [Microbulbifer sp. THAF38]|uniref:DUF6795 domain-containing protein n=1 Tax=Microbulbifer sp. THAF38 TaxID=2587856 RepID=UPI001267A3BC|nr:DUF6795 domain-containing protein [Microbulbifer sp. THAF38]
MSNKTIYFAIKTALLSILLIPGGAYGMAFLNPLKACTFSEMKIKITLDGSPAAGAKITRSIDWKEEKTDIFTSDKEGNVLLPAEFESSITQVLPVEFISSQSINVEYENRSYLIWIYAKRNPAENFEMNGNPINLACELTDEPKTERKFKSALKTSCKFL